jgi:hypothetical protein
MCCLQEEQQVHLRPRPLTCLAEVAVALLLVVLGEQQVALLLVVRGGRWTFCVATRSFSC